MLDVAILPKLNYVSMNWDQSMVDDRSPADTTCVVSAVNAAAVKYLSDQQLVQQAAAATNRRRSNPKSISHDQNRTPVGGSSNASIYGMKSANLSLASRRYFEKHHLTGGGHQNGVDGSPSGDIRSHKSKVEDLLSSITSQVNNLQTFASPKRTMSDRCAVVLNSSRLSDGSGFSNNYCNDGISEENVSYRNEPRRYEGCNISSRHSLSGISGSMASDQNSYVDMPNPAAWTSLDGSVTQRRSHDGHLRAVDRTLEFAGDIVVDNNNSLTPASQWRS